MKYFKIVVSDKVPPDTRKKLKRILKPVESVSLRPGKCELCGNMTSWTVNNRHLCPKCSVLHGFIPQDRVPDPCEVCGKPGEWCTDGDPIHSLCYIHRDKWFDWKNPELEYVNSKKDPDKWHQVWAEGWAKFVSYMREQ